MTTEDFDRTLNELLDREPFQPFCVEFLNGNQLEIERSDRVATRPGRALYAKTIDYVTFESTEVKRFVEHSSPESAVQSR